MATTGWERFHRGPGTKKVGKKSDSRKNGTVAVSFEDGWICAAIKAMSVNGAWKGRRFKTDEYKDYEAIMLSCLPDFVEIPSGRLRIDFEFGLYYKSADFDNPIKPLLDILQKKYQFNDKLVYYSTQKKVDVEKGEEYLKIKISSYTDLS